jgi:hypothetical protein
MQKGDRNGVKRKSMVKIGGAVDWIDTPQVSVFLWLAAISRIMPVFFTENRVSPKTRQLFPYHPLQVTIIFRYKAFFILFELDGIEPVQIVRDIISGTLCSGDSDLQFGGKVIPVF